LAVNPLAPGRLDVPADANALDPAVWTASTTRDATGALTVAGVAASDLAARFGTPLYVVDENDVRARARAVRDAFRSETARAGTGATVYYAGKAFLCAEVARWVTEEGLNLDVCSGGELAVALAAGVDPSRLGLHGNNKSVAEIDGAVGAGVGVVVIDSVVEIGRVADAAARHSRRQRVRLRVNTGVHASTHEYLATAREDQKFGIALADAEGAVADIRASASLEFLGLHSHIGSQIFDTAGFVEAVARLLALHARLLAGGPVPELNLGGGFGIAYTGSDDPLDIETIAATLVDAVEYGCRTAGIPMPHLAVEPGRYIVGPAGITLYEVGTTKDVLVATESVKGTGSAEATAAAATPPDSAVRRYISVDGGMSDNARPALYEADYAVRLAGRTSTADPALVRVVGKHCESGDIVVRDDYLPADVAPGDLLAVPATGAYCWSLASNYNYLARPAVVAVRDGIARVIVRGETETDLLSRDAGLDAVPAGAASASNGDR
jgi:diaminopimelate decarboxylase